MSRWQRLIENLGVELREVFSPRNPSSGETGKLGPTVIVDCVNRFSLLVKTCLRTENNAPVLVHDLLKYF